MEFKISNDQLETISNLYNRAAIVEGCSLAKFMDWTGMNLIDSFVEQNNKRSINVDNDDEINSLNELYSFVREFVVDQLTYKK